MTWVLLRGLMREQRHWEDFPCIFGATLRGATVVTPDLPGNGTRNGLRSATRVADMVEFCRLDLRQRGLAPPYQLLALSLGAMVAVEWAARHPDEIACCVLINTSMRPFSSFYRRLRWQNYAALARLLLLGGIARQERLILTLTSSQGPQRLLARWIAYQQEYPVRRANALRQLWSAARYHAPAKRPAMPMLVLASEQDRLVDARCSISLAHRWQATIHLHPNAGHDLPLDDGQWVAMRIKQWLQNT